MQNFNERLLIMAQRILEKSSTVSSLLDAVIMRVIPQGFASAYDICYYDCGVGFCDTAYTCGWDENGPLSQWREMCGYTSGACGGLTGQGVYWASSCTCHNQ